MQKILHKLVCEQISGSSLAEVSFRPKCLTPADTASCTKRRRFTSRTVTVKRLQVNVEVALTSLWSPMWSHLCPWWDTLYPGLNFLCTDAYLQTLGQNSVSPGSLHLNRTLPFSSMKLHQRCKWCAGSLLTGSEHILYPRLVQLKITLRGNVKDLNNICWNDTRASPYWRIILSFEEWHWGILIFC